MLSGFLTVGADVTCADGHWQADGHKVVNGHWRADGHKVGNSHWRADEVCNGRWRADGLTATAET